MWNPTWADVNLWLHILAACVWIGGQITVGMLVPLLRGEPALLRAAAQRYQVIAWIAFVVLVLTGIENVHLAHISWAHLNSTKAGRTLSLKLALVIISGLAAGIHAFIQAPRSSNRRASPALSGILGGVSLLAAIGAALYGVVIAAH